MLCIYLVFIQNSVLKNNIVNSFHVFLLNGLIDWRLNFDNTNFAVNLKFNFDSIGGITVSTNYLNVNNRLVGGVKRYFISNLECGKKYWLIGRLTKKYFKLLEIVEIATVCYSIKQ